MEQPKWKDKDVSGDVIPLFPHTQPEPVAGSVPVAQVQDTPPAVEHPTAEVEPAPDVLDAEIVDEEEYQRSRAWRSAAQVVRSVRVAHRHPHTRRAARFAGRHAAYVVKGAEDARRRRRAERSQADLRAARAAAVQAGDLEKVSQLTEHLHKSLTMRVEVAGRWLDLAKVAAVRGTIGGGAVLGGSLLVSAINDTCHVLGPWGVMDELHAIGSVITAGTNIVAWSSDHWWVFPLVGGGVWVFRKWKDGVRLGEQVLPERLRRDTSNAGPQPALTENLLVRALANISNRALNAAIKDGWPNREGEVAWIRPPMPSARGWSAQLKLPMGASVEAISKAKPLLAHNLGCLAAELFTDASENDPTVLDLFRLDRGVLREPVQDYPLLDEGTTNYWNGFPVGVSPRGGEVTGYVFERNYVISGIMGSGKTTLVITLLTGAILDPLVDVDVWVFADNEDYTQLQPALRLFRKGDTAENVEDLLAYFDKLQADLEVRGNLLRKHGITSVTREAAAKEPGLRPRIVVIDECQSFFRQDTPEMRRKVVNMVVRFQSKARKYGITLLFATPSPSDQNLPRDLVAVTSNRACFAIGDKTRNNVVLGDKAHENGISALGLKPKTKTALNDVGTFVGVGFLDTGPGTVRTYFVSPEQQARIVARALEARGGVVERHDVQAPAARDLVEDLAAVLGAEPVNAADCPALLSREFPMWGPYRTLTGKELVAELAVLGVKVPSTGNKWPVYPERVREALTHRVTAAPDDE